MFVGHLIETKKQSSTVRSYISAVKAVLKMHNIRIQEDEYLLASLTKACKLKNDKFRARLPIHKSMLAVLLNHTHAHFLEHNQPFLVTLYCTIFSTMFFGMFRVSEVVTGEHPVRACDVHIRQNKNKILFLLRSSKTHGESLFPQMVKITSMGNAKVSGKIGVKDQSKGKKCRNQLPCPYNLLRKYLKMRGGFCSEAEPFFIFRDGSPVLHSHVHKNLKCIIKVSGFDNRFYRTHSLRAGRSCDLYNLGVSVETIKKLGRWRSNAVYRYLKM